MASPFRFFRKYQKPLLVVAGVILMLVFVVGDSLSTYIRGAVGGAGREGAMAPNAVAVRWDGGNLTNNELGNMVVRRRLVNAFVRAVEVQGRKPAIEAGVEPRPLRVEPMHRPGNAAAEGRRARRAHEAVCRSRPAGRHADQ